MPVRRYFVILGLILMNSHYSTATTTFSSILCQAALDNQPMSRNKQADFWLITSDEIRSKVIRQEQGMEALSSSGKNVRVFIHGPDIHVYDVHTGQEFVPSIASWPKEFFKLSDGRRLVESGDEHSAHWVVERPVDLESLDLNKNLIQLIRVFMRNNPNIPPSIVVERFLAAEKMHNFDYGWQISAAIAQKSLLYNIPLDDVSVSENTTGNIDYDDGLTDEDFDHPDEYYDNWE
jgi:hypothetical protein